MDRSKIKRPEIYWQFYKPWKIEWKPVVKYNKLLWKDKFNSPRCELEPQFKIEWIWFGFHVRLGDDNYWEQRLWCEKYCDGDLKKAKETWPWADVLTKKSTWKDY